MIGAFAWLAATSQAGGRDWVDYAQGAAAIVGILIAALVAFMPYARRPRVTVEEDTDRIHSRVELAPMGGLPHVRLLVANAKRRRAAHGTRVLLEGYRRQGQPLETMTTLGHPSLDWPSAPESQSTASVTVFAGGRRPVTLGYFIRARLYPSGDFMRPSVIDHEGRTVYGISHYARDEDYANDYGDAVWYFRLMLAFGLDINDDRDKLAPVDGGYAIRILVGRKPGLLALDALRDQRDLLGAHGGEV